MPDRMLGPERSPAARNAQDTLRVIEERLHLGTWSWESAGNQMHWSSGLYALLGLIAPGGYSPLQSLLASVCEPVLRPFRRLIPAFSGIDLSPLWAGIAIQALLILLR